MATQANPFTRIWSAAMAGYKAFQEKYFESDPINLSNFTDFDARKLRNSILWAMYENTAYDSVHLWVEGYKTKKALYKHIRNIYNPSHRIGEFWKSKLLGGMLDPLAGDGSQTPSALPILGATDPLRKAIAKVWLDSNWQIKKNVFGLWTPVLGDGILKVVDDPLRKKVYMKPVHPSHLREVELDEFGNVKGYALEFLTDDPEGKQSQVTFREECWRDNTDTIYYATYRNNALYRWDETLGAEWNENYGFVPMVVLQHNDVGLDFGWSVLYPNLSKFREVDDLAANLHDQIRKMVNSPWLFAGVQNPNTVKKTSGQAATDEKPEPGRTEMKALYSSDPNAKAQQLVGDLDIDKALNSINSLIQELEREYPELRVDMANANGDISGRALRYNRSPAVAKVIDTRPNYDNAIVRAHQMAVAIGGMRSYEDFSGFSLDSYASGELAHSIGTRPVFDNDPMDKLEENKIFWENAELARKAGVPLPVYLKQQGWTDDQISEITGSEEYQLRMEASKSALEATKIANGEGARSSVNNSKNNQNNNQNDNQHDNQSNHGV